MNELSLFFCCRPQENNSNKEKQESSLCFRLLQCKIIHFLQVRLCRCTPVYILLHWFDFCIAIFGRGRLSSSFYQHPILLLWRAVLTFTLQETAEHSKKGLLVAEAVAFISYLFPVIQTCHKSRCVYLVSNASISQSRSIFKELAWNHNAVLCTMYFHIVCGVLVNIAILISVTCMLIIVAFMLEKRSRTHLQMWLYKYIAARYSLLQLFKINACFLFCFVLSCL